MTPYYPVEMGNGTPCSLRQNRPRSSTVMYICHPEAKHEILSVAEVTTCEYEVVILTPLLCSHPKYRYAGSLLLVGDFKVLGDLRDTCTVRSPDVGPVKGCEQNCEVKLAHSRRGSDGQELWVCRVHGCQNTRGLTHSSQRGSRV